MNMHVYRKNELTVYFGMDALYIAVSPAGELPMTYCNCLGFDVCLYDELRCEHGHHHHHHHHHYHHHYRIIINIIIIISIVAILG